jgi:hypothetical protein
MSDFNVSTEEAERSTSGCWMVQLFFDGDKPSEHSKLVGLC